MDHSYHQKIEDTYLSTSASSINASQNSTPVLQHTQNPNAYIKSEPSDLNYVPPQHAFYKQPGPRPVAAAASFPYLAQQPMHQPDPVYVDYGGAGQRPPQFFQPQQLPPQQLPHPPLGHHSLADHGAPADANSPFRPMPSAAIHAPSDQATKRKRPRKQDSAVDVGDFELKTLAHQTAHVPLPSLALQIKQLENDESAAAAESAVGAAGAESQKLKEHKERQRQLFGMVWLINSCEHSPTAVVPRNRIYARYVQICADNSLTPLSPASFGKLVRILFPNLTTRRLGMRGQSKYHYCGIKLIGDQNLQQPQQSPLVSGLGISSYSGPHQVQSPISSTNSSISLDDSPITSSHIHTPSYTPINSPSIANSNSIADQLPSVSHLKYVANLDELLNGNGGDSSNPNTSLQLPSIYPYLPREIDYDIADTLYSLYKVHINSLFESLRYMQMKKLFASFNNFNSTLTAPVFKLYTHESIVEWVKQCDLVMYKRMVRMLSKLQLQYSIPVEVLSQLKQISAGYVKTLSNNLINNKVTKTFIIMKLKLAKNFVNFLNRLIKIIETGSSAAKILNDPSETKSMVDDWVKLDIHEIISREIPCGEKNLDVLLGILNNDLLQMLSGSFKSSGNVNENDNSNELMIQISHYIAELPGKFNNINPRLFILLTSNLLTTCLREISLTSGQGFGAWWIVRCWVDEFLSWRFELGGLFQQDFGVDSEESKDTVETGTAMGPAATGLEIEAANVSANSSINMSGTNFANMSDQSDNTDSNVGNISLGTVDLLGFASNQTVPGSSSNVGPGNSADILLNYDTNENYH